MIATRKATEKQKWGERGMALEIKTAWVVLNEYDLHIVDAVVENGNEY